MKKTDDNFDMPDVFKDYYDNNSGTSQPNVPRNKSKSKKDGYDALIFVSLGFLVCLIVFYAITCNTRLTQGLNSLFKKNQTDVTSNSSITVDGSVNGNIIQNSTAVIKDTGDTITMDNNGMIVQDGDSSVIMNSDGMIVQNGDRTITMGRDGMTIQNSSSATTNNVLTEDSPEMTQENTNDNTEQYYLDDGTVVTRTPLDDGRVQYVITNGNSTNRITISKSSKVTVNGHVFTTDGIDE